jgi:MFS transporter, PPP family, 3-phenylpropionic acid transporter
VSNPPVSPERRLSIFFLTQFMSGGAAAAFAGIWFTGKGLSAEQIGMINSVPVFVLLMLNLVVGRLADRAEDWRQIIVLGSLAAAIVPLGLFFVQDFWGILLFWSLSVISQSLVVSVADAAAMRVARRNGTDFGAIRAWGTIGYLLVIVITGYLVQWLGGGAFLPWFAGLAMLRGLVSLTVPKLRAPKGMAVAQGAAKLLHVMKPWFLLPLFGWSMVFATHLILNGFQSLLWSQQGISTSAIGILIALGALSETAMFFAFKRFSGRYSARKLILLSSVVTVLRWIAMAYSPGVPILFGLQLLHSITFALGFLGCMNFIANWTSEDIAAEAQGFFTMLQQGTAVVAISGFGWLAGHYGAKAYLASAAFAAVGAVLVYLSIRLQPPKA